MDMPAYSLHPQSLLMETMWATQWFKHVLEKAASLSDEERANAVFVADRSPYSAAFYARRDGALLEPVIRSQIEEIKEEAGVHVITVHLAVAPELLWSRIQDRLVREPFRVRYREGERSWMETTQAWYDAFQWDVTVHNGEAPVADLLGQTLDGIREAAPAAARFLPVDAPSSPAARPASATTAAQTTPVKRAASPSSEDGGEDEHDCASVGSASPPCAALSDRSRAALVAAALS